VVVDSAKHFWVKEDVDGEDDEPSDFGKIVSMGGYSKKVTGGFVNYVTFVLEDGASYEVNWGNGDFYASGCHSKFALHAIPKEIAVTLGKIFFSFFSVFLFYGRMS
jgi:hypothetical protein